MSNGGVLSWFYKTVSYLGSNYKDPSVDVSEEEYEETETIGEPTEESDEEVDPHAKEREQWNIEFEPIQSKARLLEGLVCETQFKPISELLEKVTLLAESTQFDEAHKELKELTTLVEMTSNVYEKGHGEYTLRDSSYSKRIQPLLTNDKVPPERLNQAQALYKEAVTFATAREWGHAADAANSALRELDAIDEVLQFAMLLKQRGDYSAEITKRRNRALAFWSELTEEERNKFNAEFKILEQLYSQDAYDKTADAMQKLDEKLDEFEFAIPRITKKRETSQNELVKRSVSLDQLKKDLPASQLSPFEKLLELFDKSLKENNFDEAEFMIFKLANLATDLRKKYEAARLVCAQLNQAAEESLKALAQLPQADQKAISEVETLLKNASDQLVKNDSIEALPLLADAKEKAESELGRVEVLNQLALGEFVKQLEVRNKRFSLIANDVSGSEKESLEALFTLVKNQADGKNFDGSALTFQKIDLALTHGEHNAAAKADYQNLKSRAEKLVEACKRVPVAEKELELFLNRMSQAVEQEVKGEFAAALKLLGEIDKELQTLSDEAEKNKMLSGFGDETSRSIVEDLLNKSGNQAVKDLLTTLDGDSTLLDQAANFARSLVDAEIKQKVQQKKPDRPLSKKETREWNVKVRELTEEFTKEKQGELVQSSLGVAELLARFKGKVTQKEIEQLWTKSNGVFSVKLGRQLTPDELRKAIDVLTIAELCSFLAACKSSDFFLAILKTIGGAANLKQISGGGFDSTGLKSLTAIAKEETSRLLIENWVQTGVNLYDQWKVLAKLSLADLKWCLEKTPEPYFNVFARCLEKRDVSSLRRILSHVGFAILNQETLCELADAYDTAKVEKVLVLTEAMQRDKSLLIDFLSWDVKETGHLFNLVWLENDLKSRQALHVYLEKQSKVYKKGLQFGAGARTGFVRISLNGTDLFDIHVHWFANGEGPYRLTSVHVCELGKGKGGFECQKMSQFSAVGKAIVAALSGDNFGPVKID